MVNVLNVILLLVLLICIAIVLRIVYVIRKSKRELDGLCGIKNNEEERLNISAETQEKQKETDNY